MKLPLFHVGQLVACIKGGTWVAIHPGTPTVAVQGQIYTISDMEYWPAYDDWYLQLVECPADCCYLQEYFVPVDAASSEAIAELVAESLEAVPA
jgi:hypothetical protein